MKLKTQGFIVSVRDLQENGAVVQCLTQNVGMLSGFVGNIHSKKMKSVLLLGNLISINHYGKEKSLGRMVPELITAYSGGCINNRLRFFMMLCVCEMIHFLCGKQHGYHHEPDDKSDMNIVYTNVKTFFDQCLLIDNPVLDQLLMSQFLIMIKILLAEFGYGLNLSCCVATGEASHNELRFISPKSWSAVSSSAAAAYPNVFLSLPQFFLTHEINSEVSSNDLIDGMTILDKFITNISSSYFAQEVPDVWAKTKKVFLARLCND